MVIPGIVVCADSMRIDDNELGTYDFIGVRLLLLLEAFVVAVIDDGSIVVDSGVSADYSWRTASNC